MTNIPDFETLIRVRGSSENNLSNVLALDPGETSGFAMFIDAELVDSGQILTKTIIEAVKHFTVLLKKWQPDIVVVEDYRVYGWKTQQHAWSDLHTPRVIGTIETLCAQMEIPPIKQPAHVAKGFVTDVKLRAWKLYKKGQPHARDAIRHGCYYLLFPKELAISQYKEHRRERTAEARNAKYSRKKGAHHNKPRK